MTRKERGPASKANRPEDPGRRKLLKLAVYGVSAVAWAPGLIALGALFPGPRPKIVDGDRELLGDDREDIAHVIRSGFRPDVLQALHLVSRPSGDAMREPLMETIESGDFTTGRLFGAQQSIEIDREDRGEDGYVSRFLMHVRIDPEVVPPQLARLYIPHEGEPLLLDLLLGPRLEDGSGRLTKFGIFFGPGEPVFLIIPKLSDKELRVNRDFAFKFPSPPQWVEHPHPDFGFSYRSGQEGVYEFSASEYGGQSYIRFNT